MNWIDISISVAMVALLLWTCGAATTARLVAGMVVMTCLIAVVVEAAVPCDGFGHGLRLFLKVQCQ